VSDASGEAVEVLDVDGTVVGVTTRGEMRRHNLRHRSAYVVVRSRADGGARVLAHHRAPWKDVWPDRWDLAFGGVCAVGEDWVTAARRELAEEAGIAGELHDLGGEWFESDDVRVRGQVFETRSDGPFRFDDGEVVEVAWIPVADLPTWVGSRAMCPDSLALVVPRL
jgi:8-oxo-dGTP pyrophosphatase MutT (NUDIX family)